MEKLIEGTQRHIRNSNYWRPICNLVTTHKRDCSVQKSKKPEETHLIHD